MELISVNSSIYISPLTESDGPMMAERINDKRIADNTLTIPYPYQLSDAELFIATAIAQKESTGTRNFAIRHYEEGLIGGIGQHFKYRMDSHKEEIGYWLTPEFWGKGIMTEVVSKFVEAIVLNRGLKRIEAPVFQHNLASARVLEKNGFEREGIMKKCYCKNDIYYNGILYAKIID